MPYASVPNGGDIPSERAPGISRRDCIASALSVIVGTPLLSRLGFSAEAGAALDDDAEIADVKDLGKKAGLAPFVVNKRQNFLGLGDAEAKYCKNALGICESLAEAFIEHFRDRGFNVALPGARMTVITLKDAASYQAVLGTKKPASVGGHFDLDTNRLVVFDYRGTLEEIPGSPEKINLFTLVHETLHMLSFNTGLFSRQKDVPACISEGLATYGEFWRPKIKGRPAAKIGSTNVDRLQIFDSPKEGGGNWIPIPELFARDDYFEKEEFVHLAYGGAWGLTHYLLRRDAKALAKFRGYLQKLPALADAETKRLKIAEAELGPLATLDEEVKRHVKSQRRRRG